MAGSARRLFIAMFQLHQFFALLEPAWQADPNKTAEVLGGLIAHAKAKKFEATEAILEQCLLQLAEGHSLQRVG